MGRRGNKKHLKRLAAPKHWMLDKLSGVWAPRPATGPHKLRECLPLIIILRNRLKYALTGREVKMILMNRLVQVDGKVRKDPRYPAGFQDIITIPRTDQNFRILYDTKGRMVLVPVNNQEAGYKLCKVMRCNLGRGAIPYVSTHDGRTIRFPHPDIKCGDSIKFDLKEKKIVNYFKNDIGANVMVIKGRNTGRVGHLRKIEKHPGAYNIVHVEDARGERFATRQTNIFVIGTEKVEITLPKGNGVKNTINEETAIRLARNAKNN